MGEPTGQPVRAGKAKALCGCVPPPPPPLLLPNRAAAAAADAAAAAAADAAGAPPFKLLLPLVAQMLVTPCWLLVPAQQLTPQLLLLWLMAGVAQLKLPPPVPTETPGPPPNVPQLRPAMQLLLEGDCRLL